MAAAALDSLARVGNFLVNDYLLSTHTQTTSMTRGSTPPGRAVHHSSAASQPLGHTSPATARAATPRKHRLYGGITIITNKFNAQNE
ncbi:hypothetical protein EVAR_92128_1 [Eumeta japonica]|uniref:Uncharacterized protein n=1 Tax=Eumeta variegata TaxID=151549 RepID=A0A4C1T1B8_EUMVA|nr:hypothetical protein EVAR_92128_1 [Eumeta japonica]